MIQGPVVDATDGMETISTDIDAIANQTTISRLDTATKAVIEGSSNERIINYDHIMEKDKTFGGLANFGVSDPTYYRPTDNGKIQGAVDTTDVTVTSSRADLIRAIDVHNEGTDVMLLTTDCTCLQDNEPMKLTNSSD